MKKQDFALIVSAIAIAAVLFCFFNTEKANEDVYAVITIDGEESERFLLADILVEKTITTKYGTNILQFSADGIYVKSADCASQDCVKTTSISHSGQIIACLPHHLLITIEGGNHGEDSYDAIAN